MKLLLTLFFVFNFSSSFAQDLKEAETLANNYQFEKALNFFRDSKIEVRPSMPSGK